MNKTTLGSCLLTVVLLLAACSSSDSDESTDTTTEGNSETTTVSAADESEAAEPDPTETGATGQPDGPPEGVDPDGEMPTGPPAGDIDSDEIQSDEFGYRPVEFRDQVLDRQAEVERLDADGDGALSEDEYNGTAKLFADTDANDDGKIDGEEAEFMMVFAEIPAGSFTMGQDEPATAFFEPETDLTPAHQVSIDAFSMGATEITNAQYVLYMNSALENGEITVLLGDMHDDVARYHYPVATWMVEGAAGTEYEGLPYVNLSPVTGLSHNVFDDNTLLIPEHPFNVSWIDYNPDTQTFSVRPGFEDWPVSYLKWWGAMAFADYYDLSLPTEAEWEYVAAGGEQFAFGSGDGEYGCQGANYGCYNVNGSPGYTGTDTPEEYIGFRYPVGSFASNPFGVYDMSGNVWEGTLDWYDVDFYQSLIDDGITNNPLNLDGEEPPMDGSAIGGPSVEFSHDARVYRGGSYNYHEAVATTTYRFPVYPWIGNDHFGGRVALRPDTTTFNRQS